MAKIITIQGQEIELVSAHEARTFFRGRKGEIMEYRSFMQKIYRGDFPSGSFTKTTNGNYWFNKNFLLGFNNNNAA